MHAFLTPFPFQTISGPEISVALLTFGVLNNPYTTQVT